MNLNRADLCYGQVWRHVNAVYEDGEDKMAALFRAWRGVAFSLGFMALTAAAGAADEGSAEEAAADSILLYRPISYYKTSGDGFSADSVAEITTERALFAILDRVPQPVSLRYVPLKRAISLYGASVDDCVIAPKVGERELDIVSDVFYRNPFWIYVLKDSPVQSYNDLRSFGTVDGADMLTGRVIFGGLERTFAPNFQSLIAMLLSRRVDAIPLGELAIENEPTLVGRMRRLSEEPYVTIDMRFRCKKSERNEAFIAAVNAAIRDGAGAAATGGVK